VNLRPSTWVEGVPRATTPGQDGAHPRTVFITPPLEGWTLVMGAGLLPTLELHENGLVIHRFWQEARYGSWRVDGQRVVARFFAERRLVGAGFSPAVELDDRDDEPTQGVLRIIPVDGREAELASGAVHLDEDGRGSALLGGRRFYRSRW
jgi:hypothetical protein